MESDCDNCGCNLLCNLCQVCLNCSGAHGPPNCSECVICGWCQIQKQSCSHTKHNCEGKQCVTCKRWEYNCSDKQFNVMVCPFCILCTTCHGEINCQDEENKKRHRLIWPKDDSFIDIFETIGCQSCRICQDKTLCMACFMCSDCHHEKECMDKKRHRSTFPGGSWYF